MEQVRIHGRGGQGVVTAAELLAIAAFYDGKEAQAFPNFGVERSGAPIQAFARISKDKIIIREQVYNPSVLIIQDATLIDSVDVFQGINANTKIIINAPKNRWPNLKIKSKHLYFSPATEIALEIIGKNIVNTVILGAFAKFTDIVSLASLEKAIKEKFADKKEEVIEKNLVALRRAYKS